MIVMSYEEGFGDDLSLLPDVFCLISNEASSLLICCAFSCIHTRTRPTMRLFEISNSQH